MADEPQKQTVRVEVAPVAPTAPPPVDAGLEFRNMTPAQFQEFAERQRAKGANEVLKELGVDSKKDRRAALEDIKAGRLQLSKKEQEVADAKAKADAEAAKLKPLEEKLAAKDATLKKYADAEFAKLPENVQKAVAERFGDDPQARLDGIEWMQKHSLVPSPVLTPEQKAKAEEEAKKAAANKPANPATTIAPPGPAAAPPSGPPNIQEIYDAHMRAGRTIAASGLAQQFAGQLKLGHPDQRK